MIPPPQTPSLDHILFAGFKGEVWLQPGKPATQGAAVQGRRADGGGVCLCLAAGNQISVAGLDIIHALFHDSATRGRTPGPTPSAILLFALCHFAVHPLPRLPSEHVLTPPPPRPSTPQDSVVVCKMSEVNEACGPALAKVFAPLVERGVLRFVYGGVGGPPYPCTLNYNP